MQCRVQVVTTVDAALKPPTAAPLLVACADAMAAPGVPRPAKLAVTCLVASLLAEPPLARQLLLRQPQADTMGGESLQRQNQMMWDTKWSCCSVSAVVEV